MADRAPFVLKTAKAGDTVVFREDVDARFPMRFKFPGHGPTAVVEKLYPSKGCRDAIVKAADVVCLEAEHA